MLAALLLLSAHAAASSGREEHPLAKSISTAVHATGARLEGLSARTSHALARRRVRSAIVRSDLFLSLCPTKNHNVMQGAECDCAI